MTAKSNVKDMPQTGMIATMATRYGMEAEELKKTLSGTIFPQGNSAPTEAQVKAFLVVANQYNLNPFIKEIYAFPGRGNGIVPIVSIDGWNTLINRQPTYDGVEFTEQFDNDGNLFAVTARIYRRDRTHPTMVTEYLKECYRTTDPWKQMPARMLRHKALIQAARYAFGLAGIYDPDEAERIISSGNSEDLAGSERPTIAVISEDQRTALVTLAQDQKVIEKLGQIVNGCGFEMLADITVDRYETVADCIRQAGSDAHAIDVQDEAATEPKPEPSAKTAKNDSVKTALDLATKLQKEYSVDFETLAMQFLPEGTAKFSELTDEQAQGAVPGLVELLNTKIAERKAAA